ncbi:uncharacterized protein LOC120191902 [Hibiscus syriacus]|uniref:uncharacterized protein LOC120191902 n=1 Tax=Hibiscus syriacus TaxID=106335 RepID=UPI0019245F70|nr:uncharacterized protein LOC120191902 [Hibiscus syriacus]
METSNHERPSLTPPPPNSTPRKQVPRVNSPSIYWHPPQFFQTLPVSSKTHNLLKLPPMASLNSLAFLTIFLALHLKIAKPDFYPPFCHPSSMMYVKKWNVEKENASLLQMEHSLIIPVNVMLAGNKLLLRSMMMIIIPSFSLAFSQTSAGGLIAEEDRVTRSLCYVRLQMLRGLFNLLNVSSFPCYRECASEWTVQTLRSQCQIGLVP